MDIEEIKAFIKAGYTKEDIERLESAGAGAESGAAGNEAGADESGAESGAGNEAGAEQGGESDMALAIKALTDNVTSLTATVKAMQEKNVKGANGGKPEKSGVEDVMKSFIDAL